MDTQLAKQVEAPYMKKSIPNIAVGDTVNITTAIRDQKGEKRRSQDFKGLVIAMKNSGTRQTVTVRKVSNGVGVEKIFPIHSPNVESIEIIKKGKVRRSKIYYMRDRIGKLAMKVGDSNASIEDIRLIEDIEEENSIEDAEESKSEVVEESGEEKDEVVKESSEEQEEVSNDEVKKATDKKEE